MNILNSKTNFSDSLINFLTGIDFITLIIAGIFFVPMLGGLLYPLSGSRIQRSLHSMLDSLKLILGIVLTILALRKFEVVKNALVNGFYEASATVRNMLPQNEYKLIANVLIIIFLLFILQYILGLIGRPLYKYVIIPLTNQISVKMDSMNGIARRIISSLWQLPRSVWLVLVFSLLLNFYTTFSNSPLGLYINSSAAYNKINEQALQPLLGSDIAKKVPVLINDSFRFIDESLPPVNQNSNMPGNAGNVNNRGNLPIVIEYFNGVTLDQAVMSTAEIDNTAKKIIGKEKNDREKAYLLYKWICENIEYDYEKADIIVSNPTNLSSGSQVAFSEGKGVCFDYASLYVSMCRAVDLPVRLVTGLGFNGVGWGDHAWNQVYYSEEERWINVDTTFGSSGYNYFDNSFFSMSHKYDDIQGEW